jgi:predicted SAM-dependent methyltransferase
MKLDICTRATRKKGFLNVDAIPGPNVDFVSDIRRKLPFENGTVDEIVSCATLEHLLLVQTMRLLREFYRIMKPGSILTIAVPDLNKICNAYVGRTVELPLVHQYIYGQISESSIIEYDSHKSAYDFELLSMLLTTVGFKDIKEVEYDFPMHLKELMIKVTCKK